MKSEPCLVLSKRNNLLFILSLILLTSVFVVSNVSAEVTLAPLFPADKQISPFNEGYWNGVAFDGTNYLFVWYNNSRRGIVGQFVDKQGKSPRKSYSD